MDPSSLTHTFCPSGGTDPRAPRSLHHRHRKTGPFPGPIPPNQDCPGRPPLSLFPPFLPLKTPAGGGRGPPAPPFLTIKSSRCEKRTSRSRLPVRVECCSVPGPGYTSTHSTHGTGAAKPAPPARPLGGLSPTAATRHGGDKNDPPTPGITLQNSAQGPRVRIQLLPLAHTPLPRLSDFTPDHPQPLPWSISRCPHPHISWASVCTRTQGEGRKTPRFLIEKPRECAIPSQQEGKK